MQTDQKKNFKRLKTDFFIRNILISVLPGLVSIILISVISIFMLNTYVKNEIDAKNMNIISNKVNSVDAMIKDLERINLSMGTNANIKIRLKNCMLGIDKEGIKSSDYEIITAIIDQIFTSLSYNENIASLYIYFNNDAGWFLSSTNRFSNTDFFYDTNWMDSYNKHRKSEEQYWFETREIDNYMFKEGSTIKVFSIFQKIFSSGKQESDGVLVMNITQESMNGTLVSLLAGPQDYFSVLDAEGNTVFSSILSISDYNRNDYVEYSVNSTLYDWTYIYGIPERTAYSVPNFLSTVIASICLLVCILELLIACKTALRSYQHIAEIVDLIESAKDGKLPPPDNRDNGDLFQYVINNIVRLFIEQEYLHVQLSEKKYHAKALELYALQSQLNPHFLYNTMQTILMKTLSLTNGPNDASFMLEKLSDILHYALDDKNSIVPLYDEFRITNAYLSIQKTRNRHNLDSVWTLSDINTNATLPKLILQPIIENSIQHGMNSKQSPMLITIKLESDEQFLRISIADDGKGIDSETLDSIRLRLTQTELSSSHIGLANTSRRLKLIYGNRARLEITSQVNLGTTVTLVIPQTV